MFQLYTTIRNLCQSKKLGDRIHTLRVRMSAKAASRIVRGTDLLTCGKQKTTSETSPVYIHLQNSKKMRRSYKTDITVTTKEPIDHFTQHKKLQKTSKLLNKKYNKRLVPQANTVPDELKNIDSCTNT